MTGANLYKETAEGKSKELILDSLWLLAVHSTIRNNALGMPLNRRLISHA